MPPRIRKIDGNVVYRGDPIEYKDACEQYASRLAIKSCLFAPAFIVHALHDTDVINTIRYAKRHHLAIAIRTGGHHYIGMSSTGKQNIQLDVRLAYKTVDVSRLETNRLVTCGISLSLHELVAMLRAHECFIPHGGCGTVHLGGHVQSGGLLFTSMFGCLGDHVKSSRIITADQQIRKVTRRSCPDLFYAVLGGSPGSFGVLTHVTLRAHKDADYPFSVGMNPAYPYTARHLQALLDIMVDWTCDPNLPKNAGLLISVARGFMCVDGRWYAKTEGDSKLRHHYFNQILRASPFCVSVGDVNMDAVSAVVMPALKAVLKPTHPYTFLSDNKYTPLSILSEFDVNLHSNREIVTDPGATSWKRLQLQTKDRDLLKRRCFVERFMKKLSELAVQPEIKPIMQFAFCGNANSAFLRNQSNGTSYSHRDVSMNISIVLPTQNETEGRFAETFCQEMHALMVGEHGAFDLDDVRIASFPYAVRNTEEEHNLDHMRKHYFDSEEKYQKLLRIKRQVDPTKVFSANSFAIGGMRHEKVQHKKKHG